ncbi:MAG: preprotein translocase subunit SecG [bacterium ADurb.Bin212]|nr:MAG: preprotein translocase subunit SecG [bacterium ADurb.Bin212]
MEYTLKIFQIILALLMVVAILLQQKGSGLGIAFGGDSNFYRSRRGLENVLHWATIIIAFFFVVTAVAVVFVS